ncbi:MAG TPA: peptide chain release factor 3, partial [Verrucomicrobiae bacterium]|nr:peptide chain release factor 3 [Verrucomicrobiae bacterium]
SRLEQAPWTVVRWLPPEMKDPELEALSLPTGSRLGFDIDRNPVILFPNDWSANYFMQTNARISLSSLPVAR